MGVWGFWDLVLMMRSSGDSSRHVVLLVVVVDVLYDVCIWPVLAMEWRWNPTVNYRFLGQIGNIRLIHVLTDEVMTSG